MSDPLQVDPGLLADYLSHECSDEDRVAVEAWERSSPRNQALLQQLRAAWHIVGPVPIEPLEPQVRLNAILRGAGVAGFSVPVTTPEKPSRFGASRSSPVQRVRSRALPTGSRPLRHWGSGIVALIALGVIAFGVLRGKPSGGRHAERTAAGVQYTTSIRQQAVVTLDDGSRVTLAPRTILRLEPGFGTTSRTVALSGEARFEVTSDGRPPFIVQTGAMSTRVLGTVFTVRRVPGDRAVYVAVTSGKVNVSSNSPWRPSITMTAGVVGMVTDSSATTTTVGGSAPYTVWAQNQIVFHKAPTMDVLAALTRWYGYQFRLADSALAHKNLTVWISTASSQEALATLKLALNVDLLIEGTVVTLSPHRASNDDRPLTRNPQRVISPRIREVGR